MAIQSCVNSRMITLEVKDLTKRFGRKIVLNRLNFSQKSGILGISGSNGSGKSTLMKTLSFLYKSPKESVIWRYQNEQLSISDFKKSLGFAAPYLNLYAELSVEENLRFLSRLKNHSFSEEKLAHLAENLGVSFSLSQAFGALSSGQQQRVKLLGALYNSPNIILLDEPGTNLDESGISDVLKVLENLNNGSRLIIIASNVQKELDFCDTVVQL